MLRRAYDRILALSGLPNVAWRRVAIAFSDFRRHRCRAPKLYACLAAGPGSLALLRVV